MKPPDNLRLGRYFLLPADLPNAAEFWTVWERLDNGGVSHAAYRGMTAMEPSETVAAALERLAALKEG